MTKTPQTHTALNPRKERRLKRLGQPPGAAETDHWVGRPRRVPLGSLPEPFQLTNPSSKKLANRGKPLANQGWFARVCQNCLRGFSRREEALTVPVTTVWQQAGAYLPLPKFRADNANFGPAVLSCHSPSCRYFCGLDRNGENCSENTKNLTDAQSAQGSSIETARANSRSCGN